MYPHDAFFFSIIFFLTGVLLSSLGLKITVIWIFLILVGSFAFTAAILNIKKFALIAALSSFIIIGAFFATWNALNLEKQANLPFNKTLQISGIVVTNPKRTSVQQFKLKPENNNSGEIMVYASLSPEIKYGDTLTITSVLKPIDKIFLKSEQVIGQISFPKEVTIDRHSPPSFKSGLFSLRDKIITVFKKSLPYEEAGLLSGLVVGSKESFSDEFKNAMSKSGTTHIVALSGYNTMIIMNYTVSFLINFFKKPKALIFSFFLITCFVLLAGGEASIVRAAIMSAVSAIAPLIGRIYKPRNAIALTALIMTLVNPTIIAYDIGFQLSFLALIGIIYLKPLIEKLIKTQNNTLNWRENLTTTLSAQIIVTPLIIFYFKIFSITALLANMLILPLVPLTTGLGFLIASLGIFSLKIALIPAWLAYIFLKTEISLIKLFG